MECEGYCRIYLGNCIVEPLNRCRNLLLQYPTSLNTSDESLLFLRQSKLFFLHDVQSKYNSSQFRPIVPFVYADSDCICPKKNCITLLVGHVQLVIRQGTKILFIFLTMVTHILGSCVLLFPPRCRIMDLSTLRFILLITAYCSTLPMTSCTLILSLRCLLTFISLCHL